ncbi:MAG: TIGR03790 family protein [Planctomycetes bacterium]|nr:TIGR03790 family protein [Planctomycetota bacterium]MBI3846595.1 TIGR03790 family protein [Planctomycetota bacterium]
MIRHRVAFGLGGILALSTSVVASATGPENVVVVVNDSSPISTAIGDYYRAVRSIPAQNVCHLVAGTTTSESISRATFDADVRDPIADFLVSSGLRDSTRYLVLTKGVPLRVWSEISGGTQADGACVDSELTLLFTGRLGDAGQPGWAGNPYFGSEKSFDRFIEDGGGAALKYLVCRLDGYAANVDPVTGVPQDIKGLIDRGSLPAESGTFLLDTDSSKGEGSSGYGAGNLWMRDAESALLADGESVVREATTTFASNASAILGYASWGSNDCCTAGPPYYGEVPAGSGHVYPGTFAVGCLTTDYVSTSGRTFADGAGYGQSLIADLVRLGATGCNGHVDEPFLDAVSHPQYLLPRFAMGYQAAESFYSSIPFLSWMNVVVVDPLARRAEYPAPTVSSIVPAEGSIAGGDLVTIGGADFRGMPDVLFGGIRATPLTHVDAQTLIVRVPRGTVVGPVDVVVRTPFGETTVAGGFTYRAQPVALRVLDPARLGMTMRFEMDGPPSAPFVLLVDRATGTTCRVNGTVCFDLAFTPALRVLSNSITGNGAPLDAQGTRVVSFRVPSNPQYVFRYFHAQGAVMTSGPPNRAFTVTNRVSTQIFP